MTLRRGSKGDEVKKVQRNLQDLGFLSSGPKAVDGDFGRATRQAVADFQQSHYVDGLVDNNTRLALQCSVMAWKGSKREPPFPVPNGLEEIQDTFGIIKFETLPGGGYANITNGWEAENIVIVDLPVVGRNQCHKLMVPVFTSVLEQIVDMGLDGDVLSFGIFNPRHKMHNPKRSLSTHSWGIACDVNAATNMPGDVGDMPEGIVQAFEAHGFNWGGRWRHRDSMHFQFAVGY